MLTILIDFTTRHYLEIPALLGVIYADFLDDVLSVFTIFAAPFLRCLA